MTDSAAGESLNTLDAAAHDDAADPRYVQPHQRRKRDPSNSRRRRRRSSSWSSRSRVLLLLTLVVVGVNLSFIAGIFLLRQDIGQLRGQLLARQEELAELRPQVEHLRDQISELVEGRIPSLQQVALDQVIPLNEGYLKNISFTRVQGSEASGYEYRLVLENNSMRPVWPDLTIMLFDELGIQIASAGVGGQRGQREGPETLEAAESRSYTDLVQLRPGQPEPAYFLVRMFADDGRVIEVTGPN